MPEAKLTGRMPERQKLIRMGAIAVAGLGGIALLLWLTGAFSGSPIPETAKTTLSDDSGNPPAPPEIQKPRFPLMKLEAQYAGPFEDTIIQRWRDPIDGRVCYLYIPIRVKRTPAPGGGYIDYGNNTLGTISCSGPVMVPGPPQQQQPQPDNTNR